MAAFACTLGIVPHLLAAVTGLAALLHASGVAFETVKYAGVVYLLRLMARPPEAGEKGPEAEPGPIRTAGIPPAPQVDGHRPAAAR